MAKILDTGGSFRITVPKQLFNLLSWRVEDEINIKMISHAEILITNINLKERVKNDKKDFFK